MNEIVKDERASHQGLAIVECYEQFLNYLYPILQNVPRKHGVAREMAQRALFEQVELFIAAAKSAQPSRLYSADANLAYLRFWLRFMAAPPAPNPAPPPPPTYTFLQFMALFGATEQDSIFASSDTQTKMFIIMAAGSGGLQLDNAELVAGVNYLATAATATPPGPGLITAARASAILAGEAP